MKTIRLPSANLSRLKRRQKSFHCPGGLNRGSDSTSASTARTSIRASAVVTSASSLLQSRYRRVRPPGRTLVAPARRKLGQPLVGCAHAHLEHAVAGELGLHPVVDLAEGEERLRTAAMGNEVL